MYFSGQGRCYIAERDSNGNSKGFRDVGDVSGLNFALATELIEHNEHTSGQRLTDLRLERSKSATMQTIVDEFSKENIALACRSTAGTIASGTVTSEQFTGTGVVVGEIYRTAKPVISSLVVKDSTGLPTPGTQQTLVLGTDYEITDAKAGMIKFLNVTGFTQPFRADYSNGAVDNVPLFTVGLVERWFRFVGLNSANSDKKVMVDLYRVSFDPLRQFDLINDDITRFELNGSVLYDSTKVGDSVLGQFGRVTILEA